MGIRINTGVTKTIGSTAVGATLMKTGQTTSYRTGDDGDIEAGREIDFLTLDASPLHNDGSATINTTTNRFTDINGLQVYGDDIVLDWSTWNGSTLLGWYKAEINSSQTWDAVIDWSLSLNISSFTSWRVPNAIELLSIATMDTTYSTAFNYPPFSYSASTRIWTSTTVRNNTLQAYQVSTLVWGVNPEAKTSGVPKSLAVRTFSLSLLNVLS